jgi:hypothetical protein
LVVSALIRLEKDRPDILGLEETSGLFLLQPVA